MFDKEELSKFNKQIEELQKRLDNIRKQEELVLKQLRPLVYKIENHGRR